MELILKTCYDERFIKQAWELPNSGMLVDRLSAIHQRVVDTEDAGVRAALVKMGWTPPAAKAKLVLVEKEGGLWLMMESAGELCSISLDTLPKARWFVEAYRNG